MKRLPFSPLYPRRKPWVHKGEFGKLLIVAGSREYPGSPFYNAMAALRTGTDLTYLLVPHSLSNILPALAPEMMTIPYCSDYFSKKEIPLLKKVIQERRIDALIIGGGLGRRKETFTGILALLPEINLPMVIDADALRALAGHAELLKNKRALLTPHADEFRQLTKERVSPQLKDRQEKTRRWAKKMHITILLTGHIDVISDGERVYLNKTGSPLMTKGGFGDTLAGICGSFLAQGKKPFEAACLASYLNGKAGEMACADYREGVIASDIFDYLPYLLK